MNSVDSVAPGCEVDRDCDSVLCVKLPEDIPFGDVEYFRGAEVSRVFSILIWEEKDCSRIYNCKRRSPI
jgi:hypothetical protein